MKRICLLSEIIAAAGANIEIIGEFIDRECTGDDRHSMFDPIEIPESISDHADRLLSPEAEKEFGAEQMDELEECREQAIEAKKVTDYMIAEGIDYFHDDLVCYPPEDGD